MRLRHGGRGWQLIADLPCLQVEAQYRDLQHDVQAPRKAERRIIIITPVIKSRVARCASVPEQCLLSAACIA